MASIIPFKGILYNPKKINRLSDVVTPPYDVISEQEQKQFYERHPYNMIRLILNKSTGSDTPQNNPHTRAAAYFNQWLSEDILLRDAAPAFYLTSIEFPSENSVICRFGLIALVQIEPFEKGIILPHERTYSRIRSERFELMKVCHANFSPIFSLYSDKNDILGLLKTAALTHTPDMDITDDKGHRHKLWRITDTAVHAQVSSAMKDEKIFIADGHHRYETALNYRDWTAHQTADFSSAHPANYVMMYLSGMEDSGLIILPAHRILTEVPPAAISDFIPTASKYFEIAALPFQAGEYEKNRTDFLSGLKFDTTKNTIGAFIKHCQEFFLMTPKPKVMEQLFGHEIPECLRNLDVTVLTRLILMEILGFDQAGLDNEKLISYSRSPEEALDAVSIGKYDMVFILNPTKIEQVQNVAQEGLIMPRKSTYFYPKVITGQVLNTLIPDKTMA